MHQMKMTTKMKERRKVAIPKRMEPSNVAANRHGHSDLRMIKTITRTLCKPEILCIPERSFRAHGSWCLSSNTSTRQQNILPLLFWRYVLLWYDIELFDRWFLILVWTLFYRSSSLTIIIIYKGWFSFHLCKKSECIISSVIVTMVRLFLFTFKGEQIDYKGDPLEDFTLLRFVYYFRVFTTQEIFDISFLRNCNQQGSCEVLTIESSHMSYMYRLHQTYPGMGNLSAGLLVYFVFSEGVHADCHVFCHVFTGLPRHFQIAFLLPSKLSAYHSLVSSTLCKLSLIIMW